MTDEAEAPRVPVQWGAEIKTLRTEQKMSQRFQLDIPARRLRTDAGTRGRPPPVWPACPYYPKP